MDRRIWHFIRLCFINSSGQRAEYLRKKHIFGSIGDNCTIMDRKIPLYANLIHLGNNVHVASQVTFVTHDVMHLLFNNMVGVASREGGVPKMFCENIGCIEVGNNCFIGTKTVILPNIRIGNNVVIGACSLVNKDIPDNVVVAGIPAKIIGKFDDLFNKRKEMHIYSDEIKPQNRQVEQKLENYMWKNFHDSRVGNKS